MAPRPKAVPKAPARVPAGTGDAAAAAVLESGARLLEAAGAEDAYDPFPSAPLYFGDPCS